ncbi:MerR family transcriptional regulator [Oceanobacillus rekensis]|uniref:MerR family transcriptional regulator n=1 Tax=Oceanobacillus rekensis TaxID=937927 RepID=UPI000B453472|nr:MerR family transcriptional regulator [Oceanobacillus rekensis]
MYNIKAVSKILDMPTVTIRSWETRYAAITPERATSGHREYTKENINDLKWIKEQVQEHGIKVSQAVKQLHSLKEEQSADALQSVSPALGNYQVQIDELYQTVQNLDAAKCHLLLDLYFSQFHYRTVFYSIITPLMYKVGDAWEKDELHVVQEHLITNIVLQRLMSFFRIFQPSANLPKVMAICPQGEKHQLGLLLFTLFLKENGYPVTYIGADTPLEGLGGILKDKDIDMVAISTSSRDDRLIQRYIDGLSANIPRLKFIIGGLGIEIDKTENNRWYIADSHESWSQIMGEINKA